MSIRGLSDAEEIERGRIRYEQIEEMFGGMYRLENKRVYNAKFEEVKLARRLRKAEKWSEFMPPCLARFAWVGIPALGHWVKTAIRQMIPNSFYRKLKNAD